MRPYPSDIGSHTFAPLDFQQSRDVALSAVLASARQSGQVEALHAHLSGEPCCEECVKIGPGGERAPILQDRPVMDSGYVEVEQVTGPPIVVPSEPVHPPVASGDVMDDLRRGIPDGRPPLQFPLDTERLDPMGYGDDPPSTPR